jgi:hypothetical protein
MAGKATRYGLYKCYSCRKQFRVTVKTIFEKSHVPLHLWLQAFYLIAGSKKGISANQLHRTLGVTLKTAWFVGHRIREAMRTGTLLPPMGGEGKIVEVDETALGSKEGTSKKRGRKGFHQMQIALSLVERGGQVRSFHIDRATAQEVEPVVMANVARESSIMTDAAPRGRQSLSRGMGSRRRAHEHGRVLLLSVQARHEGHVPALLREASAPLFGGVRFSPQQPQGVGCRG